MWKFAQLVRQNHSYYNIHSITRPSQIYQAISQRQFASKQQQKQHQQQQSADQSGQEYKFWQDERLKRVVKNIFIFMFIIYGSGKATKHLINKYIYDENTQVDTPKLKFSNSQEEDKSSIYKNPAALLDDYYTSPTLYPKDLKNKGFFAKKRNYFILIVPEEVEFLHNQMHSHYYLLKRLARKKSQPLYPYKINIADYKDNDQVLQQALNITYDELKDTAYVLINEDKMKLPVQINDQSAIAFKFLTNPQKIDDLDALYEVLDVNFNTNVKYFIICNPGDKKPNDMTVQQKMFRKFFYENSSFIENEAKFIEITNTRVAQRIGLKGQDHIIVLQNKNPYTSFKGGEQFKLMNLELEQLQCKALRQANLEKQYVKYLLDFTQKEFEDFLMSDEQIDKIFSKFSEFVEDAMINKEQVIFVPTLRSLKFYKNHFRNRFQDVLFVQAKPEQLGELVKQLKNIEDIPIILTDLIDGPSVFNLLNNNDEPCIRYISYSTLYNESTKKIIPIKEMMENSNIKAENEQQNDSLYVLKYKLKANEYLEEFVKNAKLHKCEPYLEDDSNSNNLIDGIKTLSKSDIQKTISKSDITIIEVYANKCQACKQVEAILPSLKQYLQEQYKNLQVCRMNVLNEISVLKNVDKTPAFILYNKKSNKFSTIDLNRSEGEIKNIESEDLGDSQKLLKFLTSRIINEIKQL